MITFSQHLFRSLFPGLLLLLLCSGWFMQRLITQSLTEEFDRGLISRAQSIMAITEQDEDGVELEVYPAALPGFFRKNEPDYFEVHNTTNQRLFYSASLSDDVTLEHAEKTQETVFDTLLPDGRKGRMIRQSYYPKIDIDDDATGQPADKDQLQPFAPSGIPVTVNGVVVVPTRVELSMATSREALDDQLGRLNLIMLLIGSLTLLSSALLQRNAIKRAVRPIESMSENINQLDVQDLSNRLSPNPSLKELNVLADRFNGLMERLQEGFNRERRFSADLAHEIRTPLAELRTLVEVRERWPQDELIAANFTEDIIVAVERMEHLTQDLLSLSRGEIGLLKPEGMVDLTFLIPNVMNAHQSEATNRDLIVNVNLPEQPVFVRGASHWRSLLNNLIDNAVAHCPENSSIAIELKVNVHDNSFVYFIENTAPDLEQDDIPHLFDRLWRKEKARSGSRHSGLGLSLVKLYTSALEVLLAAELTDEQRLRISLSGTTVQPTQS